MTKAFVTSNRRGVVLMTVMILTLLVAMFIGAAVTVGPRSLALTRNQDAVLSALTAAESGVDYAIMRIRDNPEWRGDGNGLIINTDEFKVFENDGYVWGHLTADDGTASMFRIRFNFEDGELETDHLEDSSGPRFDTTYVSINNLQSPSSAVVPRSEKGATGSVLNPEEGPHTIPPHSLCLLVEGLVGNNIWEFDPSDPNPKGFIQSQVIESVHLVANLEEVPSGVVTASNSDTIFRVQKNETVSVKSENSVSPRVRSRGKVSVMEPNGNLGTYKSKGFVQSRDGNLYADYSDSPKLTLEVEDLQSPFYQLTWEDVKTADPDGDSIKAGTYVWWEDGTLHYYDLNYNDYEIWIIENYNDPGEVIFDGKTVSGQFPVPNSLEIRKHKLTITDDLYIEPIKNSYGFMVRDFSVIPRSGALEEPPLTNNPTTETVDRRVTDLLKANPNFLDPFAIITGTPIPVLRLRIDPETETPLGTPAGQEGPDDQGSTGDQDTPFEPWPTPPAVAPGEMIELPGLPPLSLSVLVAAIDPLAPPGELHIDVDDHLAPSDLKVEFDPENDSAVLSTEGNLRIGAKLKGEGASITAGGHLRVIGAGTKISAVRSAEEGVNLYSKGNVTLSTYHSKKGAKEFEDIKLKGIVYAWGDFYGKLGSELNKDIDYGSFKLTGTLVAYGGDPSGQQAYIQNGQGKIDIDAKEVKLTFDPSYLLSLRRSLPKNIQFERALWTTH